MSEHESLSPTAENPPDLLALHVLKQLLPEQFEEVVFFYKIPPAHLSAAAPQAKRAIELIRYALQRENADLRRLLDVIREVADVAVPAPDAPVAAVPLYLLVAVEPDQHQPDHYRTQAWLVKGSDAPEPFCDGYLGREDQLYTRQALKHQLQAYLDCLTRVEEESDCIQEPVIEIFLPRHLIHLPVESWLGDFGQHIGLQYPITVRCWERCRGRDKQQRDYRKYWRRRWKNNQAKLITDPKKLLQSLHCAEECEGPFADTLLGQQLHFVPDDTTDTWLEAALQNGMGILLWPRCPQSIAGLSKALAACTSLSELPRALYQQRKNNGWHKQEQRFGDDCQLSLLWDDYDRRIEPLPMLENAQY